MMYALLFFRSKLLGFFFEKKLISSLVPFGKIYSCLSLILFFFL